MNKFKIAFVRKVLEEGEPERCEDSSRPHIKEECPKKPNHLCPQCGDASHPLRQVCDRVKKISITRHCCCEINNGVVISSCKLHGDMLRAKDKRIKELEHENDILREDEPEKYSLDRIGACGSTQTSPLEVQFVNASEREELKLKLENRDIRIKELEELLEEAGDNFFDTLENKDIRIKELEGIVEENEEISFDTLEKDRIDNLQDVVDFKDKRINQLEEI